MWRRVELSRLLHAVYIKLSGRSAVTVWVCRSQRSKEKFGKLLLLQGVVNPGFRSLARSRGNAALRHVYNRIRFYLKKPSTHPRVFKKKKSRVRSSGIKTDIYSVALKINQHVAVTDLWSWDEISGRSSVDGLKLTVVHNVWLRPNTVMVYEIPD